MSDWVQVTSQSEFDAAIKAGNYRIELINDEQQEVQALDA